MLRCRLAPIALAVGLLAAASSPVQAQGTSATPPLPRGARWQLRLASGTYLFDVRPVRATTDSLVVARLDTAAAATRTVALDDVEELRLVQPSMLDFQTGAQSPFAEIGGANDVVFSLVGVDAAERRRIVAEVLSASGDGAAPRR